MGNMRTSPLVYRMSSGMRGMRRGLIKGYVDIKGREKKH